MNIESQINTKNSNNIIQSNLIDTYINQIKRQQSEPDSFVLCTDFIADLKPNKEKAACGTILDGYINNKPASLKMVSNNNNECWYEGVIDNKYVRLHCTDNVYSGKYGNSDFCLNIDYNKPSKISSFFNQKLLGKTFMPDYFSVNGSIGEKNINMTLPGIKIPEDPETKDLLTMILDDKGLKAQTINGEIKSIKFTPSSIQDIKRRAEKRDQLLNNDVKPLVMQSLTTISSMVIGTLVSAVLLKCGLKK